MTREMDITACHKDYMNYLPRWTRIKTVMEGADAVKAAGEALLPKLPGQSRESYEHYRERAVFFNAAGKTLELYASMVFAKAPTIKGIDEKNPIFEDADLRGKPFEEMLEDILADVISYGRCGILVDYSGAVPEGMSLAEAERGEARPYMTMYPALSITNWHCGRHGGRTIPDRIVIRETVEDSAGEEADQFRELLLMKEIYTVRKWRLAPGSIKDKKESHWIVTSRTIPIMNGEAINFIPFFFLDAASGSADCRTPPLLDLVDINISHYRTMADLEHGRFHSGLPTPIFAGFNFQEGDAVKLGSTEGISSNLPDAKAYYLEFSGQGLGALENAAKQKEAWMVQLGSGLLDFYKSGKEATETLMIRRSGANATIGRMAMAVSEIMTKALKLMARWAGLPFDEVKVQLLTEYLPENITPQEISILLEAVQTGNYRRIDWLYRLKNAGILGQEVKPEKIEEELDRKNKEIEPVGFKAA
jgi:hypothetical protein